MARVLQHWFYKYNIESIEILPSKIVYFVEPASVNIRYLFLCHFDSQNEMSTLVVSLEVDAEMRPAFVQS